MFEDLTVVKYEGIKHYAGKNRHFWLCQCVCGNTTSVETWHLKTRHTTTCGCLKTRTGKNNIKYQGYEDLSLSMWNKIKSNAKKRNHEFDITIEYAWGIFIKQKKLCVLSGVKIYFASTGKQFNNGCATASLDRINNSKGYIIGNVQWVHKDINRMKWAHDEKYFIELCQRVAKWKN